MVYKAVIFDLDGTLVDTLPDLVIAMNLALRRLNMPERSFAECGMMISRGIRVFAQRALGEKDGDLTDNLIGFFRQYYRDNCLVLSRLYEGIADIIKRLRQKGLLLAVLTNKDQDVAERVLRHFFCAGSFDSVVGVSGDVWAVKPDIRATMQIIDRMGIGCEGLLFVGDSEVDIETAHNAGICSVAVTWGYRGRDILLQAGADFIIDRPCEILDLIA